MARTRISAFATGLAAVLAVVAAPAAAQSEELDSSFDRTFGTELRQPRSFEAIYASSFEQRIADHDHPRTHVDQRGRREP